MPLQEALRVGERAVLFGIRGSGDEENLSGDGRGIGILRTLVPEGGGVDFKPVAHHQPFQLLQRFAVQAAVGSARRGILPEEEHAADLAPQHAHGIGKLGIIVINARNPAKAEIVLPGCRVAVPRLQEADQELGNWSTIAGFHIFLFEVVAQAAVVREAPKAA